MKFLGVYLTKYVSGVHTDNYNHCWNTVKNLSRYIYIYTTLIDWETQ